MSDTVSSADPSSPASAAADPGAAEDGGLAILVVDDNADSADALAELLEISGHRVLTAYDGVEAVEKARETPPRLVLLDLGLPRKDGFAVAAELRTLFGASVHLVAVTGYGDDETRQRVRDAGFDDHVLKPLTLDRVGEVLEALGGDGAL